MKVIIMQAEASEPKHVASGNTSTIGRLFVLDLSSGEIFSLNADGSDRKVIVSGCRHPDGIVVDVEAGHIYWTDMGIPNVNVGSIERANIDGQNRTMIVPPGGTFTPKQIHLDSKNGKLYWSDREGMRVMRSNLNGSKVETLVQNGQGDEDRRDQMKWCVGITVDPDRGQFYWTQKGPDDAGKGRIFRASTEIPKGQSPENRTDIEVFCLNMIERLL
jgi:sugar lactone lactonase YvrE